MSLDAAVMHALEAIAPVKPGEALSRHTTIGIGGPADAFLALDTVDQITGVLEVAHAADVPVFMLGSGSNIVIGDRGIRGVTIDNNAHELTNLGELPGSSDTSTPRVLFRAEAGCSFAAIARQLAFAGYEGLEWACGIPGTVGGAVVFNAGAYGGSLGDVLQRIGIWDPDEGVVVLEAGELALTYRSSAFTKGMMAGRAVLWAEIALWPGNVEELKARVADYDGRRLKAQPRGRNAGSFFKNPAEQPAWKLLDAVGMRGYQIGGAQFSDKHVNFLINAGDARAADVAALKTLAQTRVREQFGIELQNEVSLVGEGFGDE